MSWQRREDLEAAEEDRLGSFAARAAAHGGRRGAEPEDPMRTAFQRDRDRIIHSTAFRRLQHKTQVFAATEGDHYRSRMTHSLEVSQMARGAALALRLNPDLSEAIALAHDLGHPPFGHVGEEALNELMAAEGGFRHNAQVARIVDQLEDRHGDGLGLNLCFVLRASLLKGRMPEGFPLSPDLDPKPRAPLEASLVDHCDKIAYLCHDLDDALRAGLIQAEDAASLRLWQLAEAEVGSGAVARIYSRMVGILVRDLVEHSARSLGEPERSEPPRIGPGPDMQVLSQEMLAFLRERFYRSAPVLDAMHQGQTRLRQCFAYFAAHPGQIPDKMRERSGACSPARQACDYVAGMTDRFLMQTAAPA